MAGLGGGMQVLVVVFAFLGVPKLMSIMPDLDPLMVIVGVFLILAVVQQLGFQTADATGSGGGDSQRHRRPTTEQEVPSRAHSMQQLLKDAEKALQQNSWARVKELAKQVTDADPECARAWELLATAQKWEGERDAAAATVRKAREIYEVESEGLRNLAQELESSNSPAIMAEECEGKGEGFFVKRQYDLAAECYSKALNSLSEGAAASVGSSQALRLRLLRRRAECAQQLQDWATCRQDATELLEADPHDPRALMQRAASNEALEKFKAALEDARKLLSLDPKNGAANRIAHHCQQALRD